MAEEETEIRSLITKMDAQRTARSRQKAAASTTGFICLLLIIGEMWLQRPHLLEDLRADYVTARA